MIAEEKRNFQEVDTGIYELIKGEFSADEAFEIVNALFSKKINFHEVKNFGQLIRFGDQDPTTSERVDQLKADQEKAKQFIKEAKQAGKSLRVRSTITVEMI